MLDVLAVEGGEAWLNSGLEAGCEACCEPEDIIGIMRALILASVSRVDISIVGEEDGVV